MSATGFTKKRLDLTITLGTGDFGETVGDTVTLSGLRMTADMVSPAGDTMGSLQLRVFGLTESLMNRLTIIGPEIGRARPANTVRLSAGDENGMSLVFEGVIWTAWADYAGAPDVAFNIRAQVAIGLALKPVAPRSYKGDDKGAVDVAVILEEIAKASGLSFVNNGVSVMLSRQYLPLSALEQIKACARAADIMYEVAHDSLTIWPKGGSRASGQGVPLISPATGLVGYPALSSNGANVTSLFNPNIRQGGLVKIDSSLTVACGTFAIYSFTHSLSSEMPGGPWFTTMECTPYGKQS